MLILSFQKFTGIWLMLSGICSIGLFIFLFIETIKDRQFRNFSSITAIIIIPIVGYYVFKLGKHIYQAKQIIFFGNFIGVIILLFLIILFSLFLKKEEEIKQRDELA